MLPRKFNNYTVGNLKFEFFFSIDKKYKTILFISSFKYTATNRKQQIVVPYLSNPENKTPMKLVMQAFMVL